MVRIEGLLLSLFALPCSLVLSGIISYFIQPDGWDYKNFGIISLLITLFGILIVQISIAKPASIAAKVSPIEAARITNGEKEKEEKRKDKPCGKRKALTPCRLAQMEVAKNQKRWLLTMASLAFGGVFFMVASSYIVSWNEDGYSRQSMFSQGEYYVSYLYSHSNPKPYGITEMQLIGHMDKELEEKISEITYIEKITTANSVMGNIEYQGVTFLQSFYPLTEESNEYYDIIAEGNNTYSYLSENDAIMIVNSEINENLLGVHFKPGDTILLHFFDGEEHTVELEIGAVTTEAVAQYTENPSFCIADSTLKKLWGMMNTASSLTIAIKEYEKNGEYVEEEIQTVLKDYEDISLMTLREQKIEDSASIKTIKIQIYGLAIFIIIFSIFNLINTIISSIAARKKELSMLESIGMEKKQIRNILFWENIFMACPNILITVTLGTAAGYCFVSFMKTAATYLAYQLPIAALLIYLIVMIFIPVVISFLCLKEMDRESLIERISGGA